MGLVAVTVGFAALGAYLGRDLSGATGLVLFIAAFACILGLNIAAAKGRDQLAIGPLFGLGAVARSGGAEVVVTSGALPGLLSALLATVDHGDDVVVTDPTYERPHRRAPKLSTRLL
jgi:hypothetical protein